MTNREYLNNLNIYDLLVKINSVDECVIEQLTNTSYKFDRCFEYESCKDCLQNFLNEERVIK